MSETKKSFPQTMFQPESGSCQIVLVRHGQSAPFQPGQPFELVGGHGNPPLSPLGRWQAEQVGTRLASEPIEAIYVSSLVRTHETAAPLATELKLNPTETVDLREVFLGEFEGGLFRQMSHEDHPAVVSFRNNQEWGELPGAETNEHFQQRVVSAVTSIAEAHTDQMVAVFCHGGVIGSLLAHSQGINDFSFMGVRNASLSLLSVGIPPDFSAWNIRSYNDAAHCGPLTADAEPLT